MTGRVLWVLALVALVFRIGFSGLASHWLPFVAFDPLLVVAILGALPGRSQLALGAGLLTGLVDDAWSSRWFGENALSHSVVAYGISLVSSRIDMMSTAPAVIALIAGTLADRGLHIALSALLGEPMGQLESPSVWAWAVGINTLFGLFLRLVSRRFGKRR